MNYTYPYYTPQTQQMPPIQPQTIQPTYSQTTPQAMQNGGFMSVASEQIARSYPVAPGNVMTFKIENQPYVCEKAQGFSQLEGPTFNKYKLVKEDEEVTETYDYRSDIESFKEDIECLKEEIKSLKDKLNKKKGDKE